MNNEEKITDTSEDHYSPYCKICDSCGEDGCCSAMSCKQSPDGDYCQSYLMELKFAYLMYHDIIKIVGDDPKYSEAISKAFDENWDIIFKRNEG